MLGKRRALTWRLRKHGLVLLMTMLMAVRAAPIEVHAQPPANIVAATTGAPPVADGDVSGDSTEIIIVLTGSLDPHVSGRTLLRGKTIRVILPDAFTRTDAPIKGPDSGILTKGWPQGAISTFSLALEGSHTLVYTATDDIVPTGPDNPGIKLIHVRGRAFTNPDPGQYLVQVEARTGQDGAIEHGSAALTIRPAIVPKITAWNMLLPQPSNNNWQRVPVNTATPIPLDFLLFGADSKPMDRIGVAAADPENFPQYTLALLVQEGSVVGGIIDAAPANAAGQQAVSPTDASGQPVLSGQLTLPNGDTAHGVLRVLFRTGNLPGNYTPTFALEGGTSQQMTIVATGVPATGGAVQAPER